MHIYIPHTVATMRLRVFSGKGLTRSTCDLGRLLPSLPRNKYSIAYHTILVNPFFRKKWKFFDFRLDRITSNVPWLGSTQSYFTWRFSEDSHVAFRGILSNPLPTLLVYHIVPYLSRVFSTFFKKVEENFAGFLPPAGVSHSSKVSSPKRSTIS